MQYQTLIKEMPKFIQSSLEKRYYKGLLNKIRDNGNIMQVVDAYGLGMLAMNLALVDGCRADIRERGIDITVQGDRNVVTKKNSSVDVLKDAQAAVRFYLKEFNMTPSSRRLGIDSVARPIDDGFDLV